MKDEKITATTTRRYLKKGSYLTVKDGQNCEPRTFAIEKGVLHPNGRFQFICSASNCKTSTFGCTYLVKV